MFNLVKLGGSLGLERGKLFVLVCKLPLHALEFECSHLKFTLMGLLHFLAFFVRGRESLFLLRHLGEFRLKFVIKDFKLVFEA